jgi:hypothetical protein
MAETSEKKEVRDTDFMMSMAQDDLVARLLKDEF